jgi:hypothetical protein
MSMKMVLIFLLAIGVFLSAGCATPTSYKAASSGFDTKGPIQFGYFSVNHERCSSHNPVPCTEISFIANDSTADEQVRAYVRRRVAEVCNGPVTTGDGAIKEWIKHYSVTRDDSGQMIDPEAIEVKQGKRIETVVGSGGQTYTTLYKLAHTFAYCPSK